MVKLHCSSSFDRISELPCHIKQTILMYLPLEDMARTSILSKNWRLQWTEVPHLIFDWRKIYTVDKVFGILLQHQGPILKFRPVLEGWKNSSDIDKVISYLARNGIQDLELYLDVANYEVDYVVPSSIFACVELRHLILSWSIFKPVTFHGFSKLITLVLLEVEMDSNVSISSCPLLESLTIEVLTHVDQFCVDAPNLKVFSFQGSISNIGFMNTPLLKVLSFTGKEEAFGGKNTFDLMKLLCSLPLLEDLLLSYTFLKLLAVGLFSDKLPKVLNNLKKLELRCVSLNEEDVLSSTLWLLRNSPNLQKFELQHFQRVKSKLEFSSIMQVYRDFYLTKLQEVNVVLLGLGWPDVKFFKFLLDVSPELQKLCIDGSSSLRESEYIMVGELFSYRRASRKAKIVFQ